MLHFKDTKFSELFCIYDVFSQACIEEVNTQQYFRSFVFNILGATIFFIRNSYESSSITNFLEGVSKYISYINEMEASTTHIVIDTYRRDLIVNFILSVGLECGYELDEDYTLIFRKF